MAENQLLRWRADKLPPTIHKEMDQAREHGFVYAAEPIATASTMYGGPSSPT